MSKASKYQTSCPNLFIDYLANNIISFLGVSHWKHRLSPHFPHSQKSLTLWHPRSTPAKPIGRRFVHISPCDNPAWLRSAERCEEDFDLRFCPEGVKDTDFLSIPEQFDGDNFLDSPEAPCTFECKSSAGSRIAAPAL